MLLACTILSAPAYATSDAKEEEKTPEKTMAVQAQQTVHVEQGFSGNYLSGLFARSTGDVAGAIRYLRQAHKKYPSNPDVASQLQGLLLIDGKIEEATELAEDISKGQDRDPVSDLLLTLREVKTGHMDRAEHILDGAFDAGAGQLWLPLIAAWIDASQKKLLKPLTIEELSANVGRAAPVVNYHLALINDHAGFKEAAVMNFKNSIEDPQDPPGRIMAALLGFYERNNQPPALKPIVDTYHKATADEVTRDDTPVIANAQDGIAEVLYTMGSIMLGAGINQDAVIYSRLALYLQPDFPAASLALGDAYSDLRQFQRSNEVYAAIQSSSRLYIPARLHMAMNADRMGKLNDAVAILDKMSKQMPQRYEALLTKGDLLRMHSRFADAAEAYTEAMKRIPELKPIHWPLLFARGASYERLNRWPEAEADLLQALKLKPEQPDVMNYLGYGWLARNEHIDEAHSMLTKAVKARPNDGQIVDSMGWALYLLGRYDEAVAYIEKAIDLLPSDPTVNDHLGDAYWRQGRKTEARYQWERSLSYSPDETAANVTRKKLKEGLPPVTQTSAKPAIPVVASQQAPNPPVP